MSNKPETTAIIRDTLTDDNRIQGHNLYVMRSHIGSYGGAMNPNNPIERKARLFASSINSYINNCTDPIEAAEADLLGKALDVSSEAHDLIDKILRAMRQTSDPSILWYIDYLEALHTNIGDILKHRKEQ